MIKRLASLYSVLFAAAVLAPGASAAELPRKARQAFQSAEGHRAAAMTVGEQKPAWGIGSAQGYLAAVQQALQHCNEQRQEQQLARQCEVVRVNDAVPSDSDQIGRLANTGDTASTFLWQVDHGQSRLFLAGTIHVLRPNIDVPDVFHRALRVADTLSVELDLSGIEPGAWNRANARYAQLPPGHRLKDVLPDETRAAAQKIMAVQGVPFAMFDTAKPALLATQLMLNAVLGHGYTPAQGVEMRFIQAARHAKLEIRSIETLEQQMALLYGEPLADQIQMLADTLGSVEQIEPGIAALVVSWLRGDVAGLHQQYQDQLTSEREARFMRRVLDERNVGMAEHAMQLLRQPGTHLMMVGALHLVGPQSVQEMLASRGLAPKQLPANAEIGAAPRVY